MSAHSSRGREWEATRKAVLERDNYLCTYCHTNQATQVDHVLAKVKGGTDDPSNLVSSCKPCNLRKGSKTLRRSRWMNPRYFPPTRGA